ncbi:uncharacterized protein [Pocillopora verrucosa]|uniref:uncharacterized protein n=1 Tax=Pocillopora verrucosa TaxID=203993 RepID=UPI00333F672A
MSEITSDALLKMTSICVMVQIGFLILFLRASEVMSADLALRQPAYMSGDDGSVAALAVEGTTGRCAVTSLLTDPWWRVDLGKSYSVDVVNIISGANGLADFEIRIGNSLDNEGNSNQKCGGPYTMTSSQEKSFDCTPGVRGRYVNIRIAGKNKKLDICAVSVNSNPAVNIAAGRSATQSTTAYDGFPAHALDGNLDSHYNGLSCTHTAGQNYPWWRVDLGSSQHVSEVFIVNRVGCCMDRLRNIAIYVGDSLENNGNSNPRCGGLYSMATVHKASFYCKPRKTGRYVNIRLEGTGMFLTLCEVEVYSESRAILKNKPVEQTVQDAYDKSSLTLVCPEPFGYPEPFVAWVKDGVVLQNSTSDLRLNLSIIASWNNNTWKIDCVASNKHGTDFHRFVLNLQSKYSMCTEYKELMDGTRSAFHAIQNQVSAQNDNSINERTWYRFVDQTTGSPMQLPDSCTEPWACGTQASGWLRGSHPSMEEGVVQRTVCFSWSSTCCFAEVKVQVRNCYGYHVYKLQPTSFVVKARYCIENSAIHYEDAFFYLPVSKAGVPLALTGHMIHLEYHVTSPWKCMAYCLVEMTCESFTYLSQDNTCELNNRTGTSSKQGLRERPGTEYYERMNLLQ